MGRPLMPPALLIRSTAISTPTRAVLPPAAAVPDRGCIVPILYGLAWPKAARHGAGTSMLAPRAPAAVADSPSRRRRVVLPLHQRSFAHGSSCHRSAMRSSSESSLPPVLQCISTAREGKGRLYLHEKAV